MSGIAKVHLPDVGLRSIEGKNDQPVPGETKLRNDLVRCDGEYFVQSLRLAVHKINFALMRKEHSSIVTEPMAPHPEWHQSLVFLRIGRVSSYPKATAILSAQEWPD